MKKSTKLASILLSSLLGLAVAMPATTVYAAEGAQAAQKKPKRKTYTMSERVGKKVFKAYELYTEEKVDEALELALSIKTSKPYDKASVSKFIGNLYAGMKGKGKTAIKYLEVAVKADILSENDHGLAMKLYADLSMQERMFEQAIAGYKDWMAFTGKQDPMTWVRIGQSYSELKQYDKVIAPADKAIALYDEPNKNPYLLKLSSYFQRKDFKNAVKVQETLVSLFPAEKKFWVQLGQFYMLTEDYTKALATMHAAYINGYIETASQAKVLAQLYTNNGVPHRAGMVLEKYMKSGVIERDERIVTQLANTFHQAKDVDKAIKYYGEAAAMANDGNLYYKQGLLMFEREQHKGAIQALKKALEDKKLRKPGNARLTIAQAHFYQKQYKAAYQEMSEAAKDKQVARNAKTWLKYIKDTAKRDKVKLI